MRSRCGPAGLAAHGIGLRSGSTTEYRIVRGDDSLVGTVDEGRAFDLVHPGAVYLHQGCTYRVGTLDLDEQIAVVEPCDDDEYTHGADTEMRVLAIGARRRSVGRGTCTSARSRSRQPGRRLPAQGRIDRRGARHRGPRPAPQPRWSTRRSGTRSNPAVLGGRARPPDRWPGTLHAVEHAAIGILPLFTICDRWDVGGVSTTVRQADTGRPTIVIYDGYPGGAGIAELGYEVADRHLATTLEVIAGCGCTDGCPSCVQSPKCGNWNEPLDKAGALALLEVVLDRHDHEGPLRVPGHAGDREDDRGPHRQAQRDGDGLEETSARRLLVALEGTG